jgi:hypothetical protein
MPTWYLPITATLTQPLIITAAGGDPNSASTSASIPGSAVRGSVARAVEHNRQLLNRLVLNDSVRYLWLNPVVGGTAGRPRPISWRSVDVVGSNDSWCVDLADIEPDAWPKKAKSKPPAFVARSGSKWIGHTLQTTARFHNARDADKGAAWKDKSTDETVGAFFAYEAIAVGQQFVGSVAITGPNINDVSTIAADLRGALGEQGWFGRSRRRGYGGGSRLDYGELAADPPGRKGEPIRAGQPICVTATSPYIGRDPNTGQIDPNTFVTEVLAVLGQAVGSTATFFQTTRAGGYNRAWGSELPDTPALAAGSTVVMKLTSTPTAEQLDRLLHEGIGERYGCVEVGLPEPGSFAIEVRTRRAERPAEAPTDITLVGVERIALKRLRIARAASAATVATEAMRIPTSSLLGRLRTQLRSETPLASMRELIDAEKLRAPAARALGACRIENRTAHDWLHTAATNPADRTESLRATVEHELAATGGRQLIDIFPTLIASIVDRHGEALETERMDRVLALMQQRARKANR